MERAEVRKLLKEEGLKYCNLFLEHPIRPWEIVIVQTDDAWVVCAADERAAVEEQSCRCFSNEAEALDCFLKLARLEKLIHPNR